MQSGFNSQLHRSLGGQPPDPSLGSGEAGRETEGPRYGWFEAAEARGEMPESAWNGIGRPASPAD